MLPGFLRVYVSALILTNLILCVPSSALASEPKATIVINEDQKAVLAIGDELKVCGRVPDSRAASIVLKVDRRKVASQKGSGRYELVWDASDTFEGEHSVDVVVEHLDGSTYFHKRTLAYVTGKRPVSISAPQNGSVVPCTLTVMPNCLSGFKVKSTELYVDGKKQDYKSDGQNLVVDVTNYKAGDYVVQLLVTDDRDCKTVSLPVKINVPERVSVKAAEKTPLVISGEVQDIKLDISVPDVVQVSQLTVFCDDVEVAKTDKMQASVSWKAMELKSGDHCIYARVSDSDGHTFDSAQVKVTVDNQIQSLTELQRQEKERQNKAQADKKAALEKEQDAKTMREMERREKLKSVSRMREAITGISYEKATLALAAPRIGFVNGLAVVVEEEIKTEKVVDVYGSFLPIEASVVPGSGSTKVLCKSGADFKHSVEVAKVFAKTFCGKWKIKVDWNKLDLVIKVGSDGTEIKGDSAGAAIATAIISALTKIPVKSEVAMTGAIGVNGDVRPVGGIIFKADAAFGNPRILTLIVPGTVDAVEEVLELPLEQIVGRKLIAPDNMYQLLRHALVGYDKTTTDSAAGLFAKGLDFFEQGKLTTALSYLRQSSDLMPEDLTPDIWIALLQVMDEELGLSKASKASK